MGERKGTPSTQREPFLYPKMEDKVNSGSCDEGRGGASRIISRPPSPLNSAFISLSLPRAIRAQNSAPLPTFPLSPPSACHTGRFKGLPLSVLR